MTADDALRWMVAAAAVLALLLLVSLAALLWDAHRRGMQRLARAAYTAEAVAAARACSLPAPTNAELDRLWDEVDGMLR